MRWALAILVLFGALHVSQAHRLDECLQATRINLTTNSVELSIEVTPGVAVADQFLAVLDRNRDGTISKAEEEDYGRKLLKELTVRLDERPLTLSLAQISAPPVDEMKRGTGIVRIQARAEFPALAANQHELSLANRHLPFISVYLVNANKPADPTITILKQTRDDTQKSYRVDFEIRLAGR